MPSLSLNHVSFAWPDGRALFRNLSFTVPPGLSGIVGRNGIGKSTLARIAAGELAPTAGVVTRTDSFAYVPQDPSRVGNAAVADALGIGATVRALRAIEAGSTNPADFDAVGDDWLVEDRASTVLAALGLDGIELDRPLDGLSGGQGTMLAVGAALLDQPEVLLLDEPTNNLDARSRERLIAALRHRPGATVVITHDRTVLGCVDRIGELREAIEGTTELRWFGGALDAFEEAAAAERANARQAVASALSQATRERRDLTTRIETAGKRRRQAASARAQAKVTRAGVKVKTDQAARTEARVRHAHQERLESATSRLADARAAIVRDRPLHIELPDTVVPSRRTVLRTRGLSTLTAVIGDLDVSGPERIEVTGANGSGKTTLLETLLGLRPPARGRVDLHVPAGYLPQRLDVLDDALSVVDNVRRYAPDAPPQAVRDQLGKFHFRGAMAEARAGTLSGGERFRAALACVLLSRPAPHLLVLDEPTNNLDFASQRQLVEALGGYGGALLMVSHDPTFVSAVGVTRTWVVEEGRMRDLPVP